jgi:hypothetical protein
MQGTAHPTQARGSLGFRKPNHAPHLQLTEPNVPPFCLQGLWMTSSFMLTPATLTATCQPMAVAVLQTSPWCSSVQPSVPQHLTVLRLCTRQREQGEYGIPADHLL